MKKDDLVFYYHSVSEKQVVGLAKVSREFYPDKTAEEGDWSAVDLVPFKKLSNPVTLEQMKQDPQLADMPLIKQSRLSVLPVSELQAKRILELASWRPYAS
jgi:predicted RNA-binding protein with PUA-like domain